MMTDSIQPETTDSDSFNSSREIEPWTEVTGRVEKVEEQSITLVASFIVRTSKEQILKWKSALVKGSHVGVLILEDGTIRVRRRGERKITTRRYTDTNSSPTVSASKRRRQAGEGIVH
ncbi:hypothetical protein [Nitrososphaera sp.]|uniref:hypothetical protein n=1 Tax=Nitrososphaera sp. TaxID=1971748 RepID=UPI0017BD0060|nr:hypothetical protein [Nitrososphaera sp.]NWG36111.1 hypothetical protein [Nitrososphaera sp.]